MVNLEAVLSGRHVRLARITAFLALALLAMYVIVSLIPSEVKYHHGIALDKDFTITNHQLGHAFRLKRSGVVYGRADNRTIKKARGDFDEEAPARPPQQRY